MCGVDIYHRFSANRKRPVRPVPEQTPPPTLLSRHGPDRTPVPTFREPGRSKLPQHVPLDVPVCVCSSASAPSLTLTATILTRPAAATRLHHFEIPCSKLEKPVKLPPDQQPVRPTDRPKTKKHPPRVRSVPFVCSFCVN